MNVLVIIIVVVTVFVVIRAYALRNDEQRKQVRSEIADRIEERDNLNVEVQPKEEISTCNSLFNRSSSLEEYNFINDIGNNQYIQHIGNADRGTRKFRHPQTVKYPFENLHNPHPFL